VQQARQLVADHIAGRVLVTVDTLFWYEVLRSASRDGRPDDVMRVWHDLERVDIVTVPLGVELVEAAAAARVAYGCSLYDAFAAGLADLLGAPLYSADARAHGTHPRAVIVGD
jgi:predicted nucleic acid-binding protein